MSLPNMNGMSPDYEDGPAAIVRTSRRPAHGEGACEVSPGRIARARAWVNNDPAAPILTLLGVVFALASSSWRMGYYERPMREFFDAIVAAFR